MLALVLSAVLGPPTLPDAPGTGAPVVPPTKAEQVAEAVALSWTAPEECPGDARVREGIADLLGEASGAEAAADVHVTATITKLAQYQLDLRIETPSGQTTKRMSAPSCETLVQATALISAIAIDPNAVLVASEPEREPEVEPEPEPEPEPEVEPEPELGPEPPPQDAPRDRARPSDDAVGQVRDPSKVPLVRFALQASGGIDVATLPGVSGGVAAQGAVFGPAWRAELHGLVLFPRTGFAATEAGARIGLFAIGARGCWVPTVGPVELPVCGGAEAGAFRGDPIGRRIANATSVREPWVGGIGSFGVGWAPRPFVALVARGELVVPILRPGFEIGDTLAHRVPPVSGRFFAGLEARFP